MVSGATGALLLPPVGPRRQGCLGRPDVELSGLKFQPLQVPGGGIKRTFLYLQKVKPGMFAVMTKAHSSPGFPPPCCTRASRLDASHSGAGREDTEAEDTSTAPPRGFQKVETSCSVIKAPCYQRSDANFRRFHWLGLGLGLGLRLGLGQLGQLDWWWDRGLVGDAVFFFVGFPGYQPGCTASAAPPATTAHL